jgi:amidase
MGRTVADTAMLHAVIAGFDPRDPVSLPGDTDAIAALATMDPVPSLAGVRVGWSRHPGGIPVEPAVTEVLETSGRPALDDLGASVADLEPVFDGAEFSFRTLRAWSMAQEHGAQYRANPDSLSENVRNNVAWGLDLTATDIYRAYTERTRVYLEMVDLFERIDILALPTVQVPPFPVEWTWPREVAGETQPDYLGWMRSCWYVSATGLPAISVPCGFTDDGLPIGLQLVGRPHDEVGLLRVAMAFERVNPAWQRRPDIPAKA